MSKEDLRGGSLGNPDASSKIQLRLEQFLSENPGKYPEDTVLRVKKFLDYRNKYPKRRTPWNMFKKFDDFILYSSLEAEWKEKSAFEMENSLGREASSFYNAVSRFIRILTPDKKERKKLHNSLFFRKYKRSTSEATIIDWISEFNCHPEWQGMSAYQIQRDKEGSSFYQSFHNWIKRQSKNKEEKKKIVEKIFRPRLNSWADLSSIADWVNEFNSHCDWRGKSASEIEGLSDGHAFNLAFFRWVKKTAKNREEYRELYKKIFPKRRFLGRSVKSVRAVHVSPDEANKRLEEFFEDNEEYDS